MRFIVMFVTAVYVLFLILSCDGQRKIIFIKLISYECCFCTRT